MEIKPIMPLKLFHKLHLIVIFLFISGIGHSQSKFQKDSLQIVKNSNQLLASPDQIKDQESLIQFLNDGVINPNRATDDLIDYYLSRYYYVKQEVDLALDIIYGKISDDYHHHQSDAKFYNMQGAIFSLQREYVRAIKAFLNAVKGYQEQGNTIREHIIYNNIANVYLALGDHKQAYDYSKLCFEEFKHHTAHSQFISVLGVLIICENNLEKLASAKKHIDLGFEIVDTSKNIRAEAILNFVKSEWEFKKTHYHKAIPFAIKSKEISENHGLIQFKIMSLILLMNIHNNLNENKLAKDFGLAAQEDIKTYNNLSMRHSIVNGLSIAYAGIGDYKSAYRYKKQTDSLKTLDRNESNKRTMDRLLVQFESLKDRNKLLKQEALIAIQNTDLERRKNFLILVGATLFFAILLIVGIIIFNRQRLRLIQHRQEEKIVQAVIHSEEKERTRISSDLHDGVAADLTALKLELEQISSTTDKAFLILRNAHQMTRRISHNLSPFMINEKGLVEAIKYLVKTNNINENLKFYTNISERIPIDQKVKIILFRSTQELLQNALKHAEATEIVLQVMLNKKILSISVEDNGIGMKNEVVNDSIGLGSLRKRIELIQGEFHIDSLSGHGTTAFINLKI